MHTLSKAWLQHDCKIVRKKILFWTKCFGTQPFLGWLLCYGLRTMLPLSLNVRVFLLFFGATTTEQLNYQQEILEKTTNALEWLKHILVRNFRLRTISLVIVLWLFQLWSAKQIYWWPVELPYWFKDGFCWKCRQFLETRDAKDNLT